MIGRVLETATEPAHWECRLGRTNAGVERDKEGMSTPF
jgi:hypothetical protein